MKNQVIKIFSYQRFVLVAVFLSPFSLLAASAEDSQAQSIEFPDFQPEKRLTGSVLPELRSAADSDVQNLRSSQTFEVKAFQFTGNTVFSDQQLDDMGQTYLEQSIGVSELFEYRDRITKAYVRKGYLNSGAVLPAQEVQDGVVRIEIVEGVLSDVRASSDGHLNTEYVVDPLRVAAGGVVNVFKLEEQLQLLQQDVRIQSINARLEPTDVQGQAILNVDVTENLPYDFVAEITNHYSPNVGAEGVKLSARNDNLSGSGDQMFAHFEKTLGYLKGSLKYSQPFSRLASINVAISASKSSVVDTNFKALDIEDLSQTVRLSFLRSRYLDASRRFDWHVSGFYQHGQTFLLGEPFSFDVGREDGELSVQGVRLGGDWIQRERNQVLTLGLSTSFSFALSEDDDDDDDEGEKTVFVGAPNGQAIVINSNIQWARKLSLLSARLFARLDMQLSNAPLYGIQQFSLGGNASVRAYRENLIVRDNGAVGSMELRVPVLLRTGTSVSFAVFADGGTTWQTGRINNGPRALASVGGGVVATLHKKTHMSVYWGKALREVSTVGKSSLQDQGIHFSIRSHWR